MKKLFLAQFLSATLVAACAVPASLRGAPTTEPPAATPVPVEAVSASIQRTPLVVFGAGSLILPFTDLEAAFEEQNPDVDVLAEYHGSIQVMRHVTDIHEPIDVVATADHSLTPMLMYTALDPQTSQPYASWYIRFASNRLALAYTAKSKFASEINDQNWFEVIARPEIRLGIADPRFDASGYRALMALKLAEPVYQQPGLLNKLVKNQFLYPIAAFEDDSGTEITVPEILETRSGASLVIRGASIELLALLESGDLDYAFEYESVIRQHQLQMVALPDAINLGAADQAQNYAQVLVRLDFRRFVAVEPVFRGEQIGYGITIPSNAPHPALARRFIAFLLGPQGRQIMQQGYQPLVDPLQCDNAAKIPADLGQLCQSPIVK